MNAQDIKSNIYDIIRQHNATSATKCNAVTYQFSDGCLAVNVFRLDGNALMIHAYLHDNATEWDRNNARITSQDEASQVPELATAIMQAIPNYTTA